LSNINEPRAAETEPQNPLLEKSAKIGQVSESGDQIHLGGDEWIKLERYRELMLCRKKTSIVGTLLKYLFTNEELKQCTVTGKVSNRKRVRVGAEETIREVEKLDSRRVLILTEFFRYYCTKELGMDKWEADMEITSVPQIISTKLAAIRYEPIKKSNGSKKRKKDNQAVNPNTQDNATDPLDGDYEIIEIIEMDDMELDINNVTMEDT
ncbi:GSCOCG00012612001-RA-CDS, partial [Cotesia congregata]